MRKPDVFLALTQEAYDKYVDNVKKDGIIIVDQSVTMKDIECKARYSLPIIKTATEVVGRAMVANIVALGTINSIAGIVSDQALERAVLNRVPPGTEALNRKALEEGKKICSIQ